MVKELLYPYFLECCRYTNDSYWKVLFEDLSYGISPYSTYINKDMLICGHKGKEFAYRIQKKDPETLYNEIMNLLKNKLGMLSYNDIIAKKDILSQFYESNNMNTVDWVSIKRKNIKELYIEKFAIDMKNKFNLTITQTRYLIDIIFIAFVYKIISPNDVIIENGVIKNINGIKVTSKGVVLVRNLYDIRVNLSPEIVIDKKLMSDEWNRYLANLRKLK